MNLDRSFYSVTWGYDDESDRVFLSREKAVEWAMNDPDRVTILESNPDEGWSRDITSDVFPEEDELDVIRELDERMVRDMERQGVL